MAGAQVGLPGPFLEPPVRPCPVSDSDSDSEDTAVGGTGRNAGAQNSSQVIHSGHFMVSCPHSDSLPRRRHHHAEPELADPWSIDPTLTRLFECMSLEYSGKLVSPKWKNFKGLQLLCWDKIRLNNVIWRAWYIQYVERRKNPVCGFITPLEGMEADEHRKPEAVVLEGNYWKRRIEVVMREYHKWRIYYKKRVSGSARAAPCPDEDAWRPTEKWCNQLFCNVVPMLLGDEEEERGSRQHFDLDTFLSDISDTLFTMTQMPSTHQALPEDAYVGNADMIQPDLAPLQPSLDDMDISEIFTSHRPPPSQTQSGYQDPSCFSPMAEPLFSSEGSLMGARSLPVSPEAPLLPGTLLQVSGIPSPALTLPYLLQPSGASQLSLHSTFPGSELPLAPLPPDPPDVAPRSLSPQLRLKPTLQCDFPGKCLSLEPPAPHCVPPIPSPRAPLMSPEPLFIPASAPRFKFPYSSSPDPSLVTHPASPLSSPCFTPYIPGLGYATGMGPQGYPSPAASQLLPPTLLGNPRFAPPKGVPQGGGGRPKAKPSGTKARRLQGHSLSHLPEPSPCPSQLLTTVSGQWPIWCAWGADPPTPLPSAFSQQQSTVPEAPASLLSRMAQMSPGLAPGSSPSQVLLHTADMQPGPLQVPKAEQLSPTSACGSDWPKPSQASPGPTARLGTSISLHQIVSHPGRPESSKLESRRITHISAEQKRRFNIKLGFTTLHSLVSTLSAQPSIKVSKATTLQKTAEYICKLQQERAALQDEALRLREQIEELNGSINLCQEQLPATGVPITRQRFDHMRRMFDEYVCSSTLQNWKFWIVSFGVSACCSLSPSTRHQVFWFICCYRNQGLHGQRAGSAPL
uniref:MLX interacting protein like n=1 Tax=Catharus ustulatus TaxID=91951 RepID=A0A8C3UNI7_CATUS